MNQEQDSPFDYAEAFLEKGKRIKDNPIPSDPGKLRFTFGKYIGQRVEDVLDNDPEYVHWVRDKSYSEPLASYIRNLIDYDLEEYDRLRAIAAPSMTSEEILFQKALQHKLKYKTFNLERYFNWLKEASNRTKGWLAIKDFTESTKRMKNELWAKHPENPKNLVIDQSPSSSSSLPGCNIPPDAPQSILGRRKREFAPEVVEAKQCLICSVSASGRKSGTGDEDQGHNRLKRRDERIINGASQSSRRESFTKPS